MLPSRFECTVCGSLIGFGFLIASVHRSYLHHHLNFSSQTFALNVILSFSYSVMIICQTWIQNSKIQQFVLQDGLETMAALHRRRLEVALAVNEYPGLEVDNQTINSEVFYHNLPPTIPTYDFRGNSISVNSEITVEG